MNLGPESPADLHGRVGIVTGGNAGLGFQTSLILAQRGAHVILACRSADRAQAALKRLTTAVPTASLEVQIVDMGNLDSVRAFADACTGGLTKLDFLCNNAGVIAVPYSKSAQGFELHMATNYFGPFALTGRLLDLLRATPGSRIVNISSQIHRMAKLPMDDLDWQRRPYKAFGAYAQSKLAIACFTVELARRLAHNGIAINALIAQPGFALTDVTPNGRLARVAGAILGPFVKRSGLVHSAANAARSSVYALTSPDAQPGDYIGPDNWLGSSGSPARARPSPKATDLNLANALWDRSAQATGVSYLT